MGQSCFRASPVTAAAVPDSEAAATVPPSSHGVAMALHVVTPNGESIEVSCSQSETILMLKKRLQGSEKMPEKLRSAPSNALRLIFGTEVLRDDVRISEKGLQDGDQLSVIVSFTPHGKYMAKFPGTDGPAGTNTWATITADFRNDGTFDITMTETEITSDYEDDDYDEYAAGAAWDHHYQGSVHMDGSSEFRMIINTLDRKGTFHEEMSPGADLQGKLNATEPNQVSVRLPFQAGGCNDGVGGLLWVALVPAEEVAS